MATAFVTMWSERENEPYKEYVQFSSRAKKTFNECQSRVIAAACKAFGVKSFNTAATIPLSATAFVAYGYAGGDCYVFCARGHY